MKTYLVTGAAGFIELTMLYMLATYTDCKIVVLDLLGPMQETLDFDCRRYWWGSLRICERDICDKELADSLFDKYKFDYVVNFAAESHVDRSIENPQLFPEGKYSGNSESAGCSTPCLLQGKDEQVILPGVKGEIPSGVYRRGVWQFGCQGISMKQRLWIPAVRIVLLKGADLFVKAYFETFKMPVSITRCSNNYGPYHFPKNWFRSL